MADEVASDDPQTIKGPVITHMRGAIGVSDDILDDQPLPTPEPQGPPLRRGNRLLSRDPRSLPRCLPRSLPRCR